MGGPNPRCGDGSNGSRLLRHEARARTIAHRFVDSSPRSIRGYVRKNWAATDFSRWDKNCIYRLQNRVCSSVDAGR
jgi:hypothetical protein